jgi:hypothetical protein
LVLLPEVPAKLGGIVKAQGPAHLLASRILVQRSRLDQVARHQQPQFPLGQGSQQLGVTVQEGTEVDGRGTVDQVHEHVCAAVCGDTDR